MKQLTLQFEGYADSWQPVDVTATTQRKESVVKALVVRALEGGYSHSRYWSDGLLLCPDVFSSSAAGIRKEGQHDDTGAARRMGP